MEKIFGILQAGMERPTNYGWFHLIFIILDISLIVFLCLKFKNPSVKTLNKIAWVFSTIMITLEIYKQIIYTYEYVDGVLKIDYQWYAFPFQFCSVPMYVMLLIPFTKNKVRESLLAFLATFGLFAGIACIVYPNDVFCGTIGINIQTMVHHGIMLIMGFYLLISGAIKLNLKTLFKGTCVFGCALLMALVLNLIIFQKVTDTFNMFYVSPYYQCTLPILNIVYEKVPYLVFLLIYSLGFVFVSWLIMIAYRGISKISQKKYSKNYQNKNV